MRFIFNHEHKLVSSLLPEDTLPQSVVPRHVTRLLSGPDAALIDPIMLNESFTIYFEDDESKRLKIVDCALGMPEAIGNEILLTKDEETNNLVFLEFMGPSIPSEGALCASARELTSRLRGVLDTDDCLSLATDFGAVIDNLGSPHVCEVHSLAYSRFLLIDSTAYFFLGTSKKFMSTPWDSVEYYEMPGGECQEICCGSELALDGWCKLAF